MTSSDEHLADQPPGLRKDDYRSAILKKLEWQGNMARKANVTAVIRGGDFFHVKAANKTTMSTLAAAADIHRGYPCRTFALAGNHDMSYNDPASISRQPLGVMLKSGVFSPLSDETFESGSLRVRVVGVDYTTDMADDGLRDIVRKKPGADYTVAVVHALAAMAPSDKIQTFFNERIFDYRDLVYEGCPDVYVFGHYHKDQGIQEHLGVKFVNLGAVSSGALILEEMERKPKVALLDFDSAGIHAESIDIPSADPNDIFDVERKMRMERERQSLNDFINLLRVDAGFADGGVESRVEAFRASKDFPDDVKTLVLGLLEAAESGAGTES